MKSIRVLDVQTSNRIAAGEVVDRPASVVKELVENAIDAGATALTVEIREGGIEYIRVSDNGSGIPPEQARIAFERHATSKIASGDALTDIASLGFRGEALPSIAAVSKVEMTTRLSGAQTGVRVRIEGGTFLDIREAGSPEGTTIVIKDLFYNVPARRKFLKRPSVEAGYIFDVVVQQALGNPHLGVRLVNNSRTLFHTPGDGDLRAVVHAVHGAQAAKDLIAFSADSGATRIEGLLGLGENSRGNRSYEFFFVNGRSIQSKLLSTAVEVGCANDLMVGRFPYCILKVTMPTALVDVNVHPNKLEVRFSQEAAIRDLVQLTLEKAIQPKGPPLPAPPSSQIASYDASESAAQPPAQRVSYEEFGLNIDFYMPPSDSEAPKLEQTQINIAPPPVPTPSLGQSSAHVAKCEVTPKAQQEGASSYRIVGQAFLTYIILEIGDRLLIIDQHAAHERLLYEKLQNDMAQNIVSQRLLTPYIFRATPKEQEQIAQLREPLMQLGFDISGFDEDTMRVDAVPQILGVPQLPLFLEELVSFLLRNPHLKPSDLRSDEIASMACHKAIKAGDRLEQAELDALMQLLGTQSMPLTCPHGRPIWIEVTKAQLEKRIKRTV